MQQLALDLFSDHIDPITCPHRGGFAIAGVSRCWAHEGTFTNCTKSICGQPPTCCYTPLDNSAEAKARRLEWMKRNKMEES
jgi:hypothetical protein